MLYEDLREVRLLTVEPAGEVAQCGLDAVHVDGRRSVDRMTQALAHRFGLDAAGID